MQLETNYYEYNTKIKFKICLSQRKYGLQGQKYLQFSHLPGKIYFDPTIVKAK